MSKKYNVKHFYLFFLVLFFCGLFSSTSYAVSFDNFVKDLRKIFYSVLGKATLFGYTKDFVFAEIKEGSFKAGDLVVINSDALSGDELAYGEVEDVKGKMVRIYITNAQKPLRKDAVVMGVKKIYANIKVDSDEAYIKSLFLKEKDIKLQDVPDEKTNVTIVFDKKEDASYTYKVLAPSGRILVIGKLTLQNGDDTRTFNLSTRIAFDQNAAEHWLLKDDELFCYTCSVSKSTKINTDGKVLNMFSEDKKLYLLTENDKTFVYDGDKIHSYDGLVTQDEKLLYVPKDGKIYELVSRRVVKDLPQKLDYIYYWADNSYLAKKGEKLILSKVDKTFELSTQDAPIIRVKKERLYLYREIKETVPLSGDYLALYLDIYDLKDLSLIKRFEIKESLIDFDVDEKNDEIIAVKYDGTIKRIKF